LVFDADPGPGFAVGILDLGDRFRLVANTIEVVPPAEPLPKLPVARAMWHPRPDLRTNAAAWIHAGGSHHTSLGFAVTTEHLADFASMCGSELLVIDEATRLDDLRDRIRWNDLYHRLSHGL
ncbi:MAG TPA: L-arabinose isomerase, partial [Candidatus Limnocylindrales bacterium]|nr:L-arabinose isomerase [Candidatus Limnocylindrales bacterium]